MYTPVKNRMNKSIVRVIKNDSRVLKGLQRHRDIPDLLAHLSQRLIGELIVYPWSGIRRPSVVYNAQTSSSQKPLGRSKPNFIERICSKNDTQQRLWSSQQFLVLKLWSKITRHTDLFREKLVPKITLS